MLSPAHFFPRFLWFIFLIGALMLLLAGCASSGPIAEAPSCRGAAFALNQAPAPQQTAGAE